MCPLINLEHISDDDACKLKQPFGTLQLGTYLHIATNWSEIEKSIEFFGRSETEKKRLHILVWNSALGFCLNNKPGVNLRKLLQVSFTRVAIVLATLANYTCLLN